MALLDSRHRLGRLVPNRQTVLGPGRRPQPRSTAIFQKLRYTYWYLCIPPAIRAINILEAVIRDFQCAGIHGVDPTQGMVTWGGPWNYMNGIAGILNLLAISGWIGIFVANNKSRAIIWGDLTIWWIIAYDLWNLAYVYNCLADRAWYCTLALLLACTIPACTWAALIANVALFVYWLYKIIHHKRNPITNCLYFEMAEFRTIAKDHADDADKYWITDQIPETPAELGFEPDSLEPPANAYPVKEKRRRRA